ncbi:tRNA (guanosine(46)-N7)-methyltransferase TrmB [Thermoactinomyces mirandus]|uniref:tRNA (guanine-N(7)-)-methyltransferase n=1 Tax=Thermoactinomyces mirandus TaxID=2756294 RepID=A0A7W1XR06_9BACL|nr:tRNA (guanosine(46)-N7)-methyltransferase TrmB [Thermoactinomyces mirandus]MBA4601450.1 tRNA (guanosine(46)-N7)-methyltransferase TrmB [Thermoactinomyces mirandus]
MRLRRNPEASKILSGHPMVFRVTEENKSQWRGRWHTLFPDAENPVYVELGTGKGQFLAEASTKYPEINWIGIERIQEPLLKAVRKGEETENANLRFIWMDAKWLDEVFEPGEIKRIYLHFSDPWPKKRHAKRRLTHHFFLKLYRKVLAPDGDLILKTDSVSLFDFSLQEFADHGWELLEKTRDLYNSPFKKENIATEYEEKFVSRGLPIHYVRVKPVRSFSQTDD